MPMQHAEKILQEIGAVQQMDMVRRATL